MYDQLWRNVSVPSAFLERVCPMAESIIANVQGICFASSIHFDTDISPRETKFSRSD